MILDTLVYPKNMILTGPNLAQHGSVGPSRVAVKDFGASIPEVCTESRGASFGTSPGSPQNIKNHTIVAQIEQVLVADVFVTHIAGDSGAVIFPIVTLL